MGEFDEYCGPLPTRLVGRRPTIIQSLSVGFGAAGELPALPAC